MKPSYLTVIALLGTLAAGYALVEYAESDREIWIAIGAWLLGFWFASGINGARDSARDEAGDEDEDEDLADDEDWEDDEMNDRD